MTTRNLSLTYNPVAKVWVVDIRDPDNNPIALGIPLVTGTDLLGQLKYLGFEVQMLAQTDYDQDAPPTFENLGSSGHLYLLTP